MRMDYPRSWGPAMRNQRESRILLKRHAARQQWKYEQTMAAQQTMAEAIMADRRERDDYSRCRSIGVEPEQKIERNFQSFMNMFLGKFR